MAMDFTFESVCKIVKHEHPELAPDIDAFLNIALTSGVTTLAIPIAAASGAVTLTPALIILTAIGTLSNLFGVKNEISKVGERIISKITSKREQDVHVQYMHMQDAYTLICYTAFFEALTRDKQLAPLLKKIKMKREEKINTAIVAARDLWGQVSTVSDDNEITPGKLAIFKYEIAMPQPGDTFEAQRQCLAPLYDQLARRIAVFFELETIKPYVQKEQGKINLALTELPTKALDTFIAQYNMLAMKFPEFAVWLNLQKDDKIIQRTEQLQQLLENNSQVEQRQTNAVLRLLTNQYKSIVDEPIIDDPDSELTYPKKRDIFIFQSFKVTHYKDTEQLKESFWNSLPERNDLEVYLRAYFNHEESSTKTPLIILGQPGSGKSLLTSMIAAQLIPLPFTPIRVELRHTNAEDPISAQIEGQIRRDTDRNFDWTTLRDHTINGPALVLFDGYDELLQATGNVFSGYPNQVKEFQNRQLALSEGQQSVRAVLTSRFTLIDKAVIPPGSTVIRLLEFDEERQNQWINKWNRANTSYFQQKSTRPFNLPQNHENVKKLAVQPLLLMMLAIYDAKGNPLSKAPENLDQSSLYDRLLRRFIERELQKNEEGAQSWQQYEMDDVTDHEMKRLGVAAIGMFNRRTVSIRAEELDADLKFFDLEESSLETVGYEHHTAMRQMGRKLLPSEKLFGSFFFQKLEAVRKTEEVTKDKDRNVPARPDDTAYEFLHNTFGEFLTADFMLRQILEKTEELRDQINKKSAKSKRFSKNLASKIDLATFDKTWYACFMYAPLFARPVVLRLLYEWSQHYLQKEGRDLQEFLQDFDTIITNHINALLSDNDLPALMTSDKRPFVALSTIGYIAIYTLNLLLLRTFLGQFAGGYTFDETNYIPSEDGTRAWDRLTYLWRSWFSLETLNELAAILKAERDDTKIHLSISKDQNLLSSSDRLNLVHSVSETLADNITAGLSGFLLHDSFYENKYELDSIIKKLSAENIDTILQKAIFTKQLRHLRQEKIIPQQNIFTLLQRMMSQEESNSESNVSFLTEVIKVVKHMEDNQGVQVISDTMIRFIPEDSFSEVEILRVVKTLNDQYLLHFFRSVRSNDFVKNFTMMAELIELLQEANDWAIPEYIKPEYLKKLQSSQGYIPARVAIEMVQLAREVGNQQILDCIKEDYQNHWRNILASGELITVDLATELVKQAREYGDWDALVYFERYLLNRLKNLNDIPTLLIIEVIEFAREANDQQHLGHFLEEYIGSIFDIRPGTSEKRLPIFLTIKLLNIVQNINSQDLISIMQQYTHKIILLSQYLSSELAVAIIKFARQINDKKILEHFHTHYLTNMLQAQKLVSIELAVELIKLAQESKEHDHATIENFYHHNITPARCYLGLLPIDTIVDLRRLAQTFGDDVLLQKINERLT